MNRIVYSIILIVLTNIAIGQNNFSIIQGSLNYYATISVKTCAENNCEGNGTIKLYLKNSKKLIQTLTSENLYFSLDKTNYPTVNIIELYGEQSPLIFDDFNFDGTEDLAIRNGNHSSYGGPSFDVYVYNITRNQFILSDELTELASKNLGMFQTDRKKKRLITFAKSGCCWHITKEYLVIPNYGLLKVHELEEDATDKEFVIVTTRDLINNEWISKKEKLKIEDYHKK